MRKRSKGIGVLAVGKLRSLLPSEGGQPQNLTRTPALDTFPTWTPDGRGATFVSNPDKQFEIYTLPLADPH